MAKGVHSIPLRDAADPTGTATGLADFIVGPENETLLHAVDSLREQMSNADPPKYNPLVFCGTSGTGKTTLSLGIGRWSWDTPLHITGADFARRYADAVDTKAVGEFRDWYASADLFVLDDLESLGKKAAAQLELSHLIDGALEAGRQVIVTCRQTPALQHSLSSRLMSRLHQGLVIPFQIPGDKTRRVLLKRLSASLEIAVSKEAIQVLAAETRQTSLQTVPQLRHALLQISSNSTSESQQRLQLQAIDREKVEEFLSRCDRARIPTLSTIATTVSRYYRLKITELRGPTRQQHVVRARGVAMYLARQLTQSSLSEVGSYFGGRDHTTVLHACRKTETLLHNDLATQHAVEDLLQQLDQPQESSEVLLEH